MANCVLYSVIIAFYVCKGWKKRESNKDGAGRSKFNEMAKEKYEGQASEIRAKLSKAKAEIERIKTNGKITKKGKRNRAKLMRECKKLTVANLVAYMEKEKSNLRRLKRGYWSMYELAHCLSIVYVLLLVSAQHNSCVNSEEFDKIARRVSK